jgi:hypothetical protein
MLHLLVADLWLSRRGYDIQLMHGLQVWAMMDCKYGYKSKVSDLFLETLSTAPEKAM